MNIPGGHRFKTEQRLICVLSPLADGFPFERGIVSLSEILGENGDYLGNPHSATFLYKNYRTAFVLVGDE